MRLYVMRHGPAEDSSPSGRDFDRSLSAHGRTRTKLVARELEKLGERPARIISSPLRRAVQTADIVAGVLGGTVEFSEQLAPSEAAPDIVRELAGSAASVLVVGHAPDVSILVVELIGKTIGFEPAMVVAVDIVPDRPAAECFVLRPSALE